MTFPDAVGLVTHLRLVLGLSEAEDLIQGAKALMQENAKLKQALEEADGHIMGKCGCVSDTLCAVNLSLTTKHALAPPPGAIPGGKT